MVGENRLQMVPNYETPEHGNYRRTVVGSITNLYWDATKEFIPEDVLMVADKWAYLANVRKIETKGVSGVEFRELIVFGLKKQFSIEEIIGDFYPESKEVSLIPEGEKRIAEAQGLGKIVSEDAYWYVTQTDSCKIHVYSIRDVTKIVRNVGNVNGVSVNNVDLIARDDMEK
jgi:hypothetical protein